MKKIAFLLTILMIAIIGVGVFLGFNYLKGPVDTSAKTVDFKVEKGDTFSTIGDKLKQNGLIRDITFYKLYLKIKKPDTIKEGIHEVSAKMNLDELIKELSSKETKIESIDITFKEGRNMRYIVKTIKEVTGEKEEDIYAILKDEKYLNELIEKYWFITEDIKNKDIYYSLEGYLYPDTYKIEKEKLNAKEIFNAMLDNMELKIKEYASDIKNSKYSFHELLTLASMVESEVAGLENRKGVASVFYNRLNAKMSLGSDVTTYYGIKIDMGERDLYKSEVNAVNNYNTRSSSMAGKLPVGPVCNPSIESIEAVLFPEETNYYYFVTDKNKKVYFSKTSNEHNNTINKLKKEGLWYVH